MSIEALPQFDRFNASTIESIVDAHLKRQQQLLDRILATELEACDYALLFDQWNELESEFEVDWSAINHLEAVNYDDEFHEAYANAERKVSEFYTALAQEKSLYERLKHLDTKLDTQEAQKRRVLDKAIQGFELSGIDLEGEQRARMTQLMLRASEIATEYSSNIIKSSQAWQYLCSDEKTLEGIPENFKKLLAQNAQQAGESGYLFKLDAPLYLAVMTHAKSRALRERFARAFATRASAEFPATKDYDNTPLVSETLANRYEKAQLLGFENYAELSLETKMAQSPEQVVDFLEDLYAKTKPQAIRELEEIEAAAAKDGIEKLEAWDITYYSERLKEQQYDFSEQALRPYFEFNAVIDGMFDICGELFDFEVKPLEYALYDEAVRLYGVYRDGEALGQLIVDPFSRESKRPGAWMADAVQRQRKADGELQLPAAYLTCNATAAADGEPVLISHEDVETLFHEFGHTLHHLLTQVDLPNIAGIAGVEWDAVELPSQFLEHWCWQPEALERFAKHHESQAPIPAELIEKALAAKNHHSALPLLRQIQFAIIDLKLHMQAQIDDPHAYAKKLSQHYAVAPMIDNARTLCAFGHLFAGGYAAGYYAYLWAEVLSSDAFSRFEQDGVFDQDAANAFRKEILERGSSRDAMDNFVAYRGREPDPRPLLRHRGIEAA